MGYGAEGAESPMGTGDGDEISPSQIEDAGGGGDGPGPPGDDPPDSSTPGMGPPSPSPDKSAMRTGMGMIGVSAPRTTDRMGGAVGKAKCTEIAELSGKWPHRLLPAGL